MKEVLTEDLPSSGAGSCQHVWQMIEGGSTDPNQMMLACSKANCNATKLVARPQVQESKAEKPVLLG